MEPPTSNFERSLLGKEMHGKAWGSIPALMRSIPTKKITKELTLPTQRLKARIGLDGRSGSLLPHGITAPTTLGFDNKPPSEVAPIPAVANPNASYVLQVDGVDISQTHPGIDWARHLPPEVALDRREHDKYTLISRMLDVSNPLYRILDLSFKFFASWAFRVVPSLFLRDMYRALSVSRFDQPPRTPHYSPMLHNAVVAVSTVFSDDPRLRDPNTRQYFARAAHALVFQEIQRPNISTVLALAFIGTFYTDIGDQTQGELFFGMSSRLSLTLGLGVDSTPLVKSGLIAHDEMIGRNWAHWTIFSLDVCWALYFGREFVGPPQRNTPLPFVDSEMDLQPWHHPPSNIPPQPNYLTRVFFESSTLLVIGRQITDVVNGLRHSSQSEVVPVHEHITRIDLELNNWKRQLPPQLDITPANRRDSTPQRLMLHLVYWWCSITLHRPFFNRRTPEIDHARSCTHAAENILELLETWSTVYTMRLAPLTMQQVIFSAGTIFLLRALQATASPPITHDVLRTALAQAETSVRYLHELGQTWTSAMDAGNSLRTMLEERLKPVIKQLHTWSRQLRFLYGPHSRTPLGGPHSWIPATAWSQSKNLTSPSQMQSAPATFHVESSFSQTAVPDPINRFFLPDFGYFGGLELWEEDLSDSAGPITSPNSSGTRSYQPTPTFFDQNSNDAHLDVEMTDYHT
ncbi:Zn(2)-C6 fungal-type domain-containing protein [Mycena sanguinolenta]|uniref:Zn(2)-C6 fungal-type domain-containing protein n=1 Tax=Mycena sanguinolenta TaxID=230812 RepID=A0A8H6WT16_9AGAR|nr:Zn(2)-C6 fungal-type domain-containing protein [Mycena sanguinolenta]